MKRLFALATVLTFVVAAFAQTPQEILSRMETELDKHEADGVSMITDVKVPIVGTISTKTYMLGDYFRMETKTMGIDVIVWEDDKSTWTYNSKTNEVKIEKAKVTVNSEPEGDLDMFEGLTDGYDITLAKETDKAWFFTLKKQKTNKSKEAPKQMDISVSKGTYLPLSLSAKVSGMTMTMHDISFGVSKSKVVFNAADFPGVTIKDER
ncbi:MAG: hypothetical protein J5814_05690 [Bacteroidaceae bacterium]|nr:hypothetical protein [Bacteroidaceae bacterium]